MSIDEPSYVAALRRIRIRMESKNYIEAGNALKEYGQQYAAYALAKVESAKHHPAADSKIPAALENAAEILFKFDREPETSKLEEWQACYAILFRQLNDLVTHRHAGQVVVELAKIAKEIHYPECWDTAAYPTIYNALHEMAACCKCAECKPSIIPDADQRPPKPATVKAMGRETYASIYQMLMTAMKDQPASEPFALSGSIQREGDNVLLAGLTVTKATEAAAPVCSRPELLELLEWPLGEDGLIPRMHSDAKAGWKRRIMEIGRNFAELESQVAHPVPTEREEASEEEGAPAMMQPEYESHRINGLNNMPFRAFVVEEKDIERWKAAYHALRKAGFSISKHREGTDNG